MICVNCRGLVFVHVVARKVTASITTRDKDIAGLSNSGITTSARRRLRFGQLRMDRSSSSVALLNIWTKHKAVGPHSTGPRQFCRILITDRLAKKYPLAKRAVPITRCHEAAEIIASISNEERASPAAHQQDVANPTPASAQGQLEGCKCTCGPVRRARAGGDFSQITWTSVISRRLVQDSNSMASTARCFGVPNGSLVPRRFSGPKTLNCGTCRRCVQNSTPVIGRKRTLPHKIRRLVRCRNRRRCRSTGDLTKSTTTHIRLRVR